MRIDGDSYSSSPLEFLSTRTAFSWLRERDIDLLICAELHAQGELMRLFLSRIGAPDAAFHGAWVSHTDTQGETDLVLGFSSKSGEVVALVENKIAAPFQPDQAERYALRARAMSPAGGTCKVVTVLFAPKNYMSRTAVELFDLRITYEEAAAALRAQCDPRSTFLANALEAGVEAYHRGYAMVADSAVTEMWKACWSICQEMTPQLHLPEPSPKPRRATWMYFRDAEGFSRDISQRVCVVYKAGRGRADLQFRRTTAVALTVAAEGLLDKTMKVVAATKSASIRIEVPVIDFTGSIEEQQSAIQEGFIACERLRAFFVEHGRRLLGSLTY